MAHRRFEFAMPAPSAVVFDAFHDWRWRMRWDSLVARSSVQGGGTQPHVGAVTENAGAGMLSALSMRTRFVSYERGRVAAAAMEGTAFPFTSWAASMRHRDVAGGGSVLIYTYTFEVGPRGLAWLMEPPVRWMFDRQTVRRFARLQRFLEHHAAEVAAGWPV